MWVFLLCVSQIQGRMGESMESQILFKNIRMVVILRTIIMINALLLPCTSNASLVSSYSENIVMSTPYGGAQLTDPSGITGMFNELVFKDLAFVSPSVSFELNKHITMQLDNRTTGFDKLQKYLTNGINEELVLATGLTTSQYGFGSIHWVYENTISGAKNMTDYMGHNIDRIVLDSVFTDYRVQLANYANIPYYYGTININVYEAEPTPTPTPIPAAVWLLGSGLMGLVGLRKKLA
jgi:hypothetical protein